jgi:hypothetical protein
VRRGALAFALAALFFGRQIAAWSDRDNRYLYHWQRPDGWYLIASVLLTAVFLFLVVEALRRAGGARVRRWLGLAFALALGQVLVGLVLAPDAEKPFEGAQLASFTVLGLTLWWWRRNPGRVVRVATTAALLAVPLGPILFLQILSWRSWPLCGPDRAGPPARPGERPVYLLLFDEWSLARSVGPDGRFLPELVNLRRLAAMGTTYTEARSPGDATYRAIPRLLYGENGEVIPGDGAAQWRIGDSIAPAAEMPSIFEMARDWGYRTELVGWYLPYASLVGKDLDGCQAWTQVYKRPGFRRLVDQMWENLRYLPDPLSRAVWRSLYARAFSENWYALEQKVEDEAMRLARRSPDNTFGFVHFPLPHAPFVFGAGGQYLGPFDEARMHGTVEDNARHLRVVDALVGRFMRALDSVGRLDSAVVVLTSDHSWKKDPDRRERSLERLRRVPLIVREPGRTRGRVVREPTCLYLIYDLLRMAVGDSSTWKPSNPDCSAP